jgi:hypothetical protein
MRNFARAAVVFGSITAHCGAATVIGVGCGGDDTVVPVDSSADIRTGDSPGIDVANGDTGSEAGDEGGDANDGGVYYDVVPPPLDKFIETVMGTYCDRIGECCIPGKPANWDRQGCIDEQLTNYSVVDNLAGHRAATQNGGAGIQYDTTRAAECLFRLHDPNADPCTITSAEYLAIRDACYGALKGTVALNAKGCTDAIQCASPGRCDTSTGNCVPFLGDGGLCQTSDDCSYRGSYQPQLFCDDDPDRHPGPDGGWIPTCSPLLPLNATCGNTTDYEGACLSGVCNGLTCQNSLIQDLTGDCVFIKDAGAGG